MGACASMIEEVLVYHVGAVAGKPAEASWGGGVGDRQPAVADSEPLQGHASPVCAVQAAEARVIRHLPPPGDVGGGGFIKHGESQLQIGHGVRRLSFGLVTALWAMGEVSVVGVRGVHLRTGISGGWQ